MREDHRVLAPTRKEKETLACLESTGENFERFESVKVTKDSLECKRIYN